FPGAAAGDPAPGTAEPAVGDGAVLRARPGGGRGDHHLRRQPARHHPHPAPGDLSAARERPGGGRGIVVRADGGRDRGDRRGETGGPGVSLTVPAEVPERGADLELEFPSGATTALVGAHGAGKPTVLALIGGTLRA